MKSASKLLRVPRGREGDAVRSALRAIDRVHRVPSLPTIPLMLRSNLKGDGAFVHDGATPYSILLNPSTAATELTVVHEVAHYLDHSGIGHGAMFELSIAQLGPKIQSAIAAWSSAAADSIAVKSLVTTVASGKRSFRLPDGTILAIEADVAFATYLLRQRELFARSYSQYIAMKSRDERLRAQVEATRALTREALYYAEFWEDNVFSDIADTLDSLIAALGWAK